MSLLVVSASVPTLSKTDFSSQYLGLLPSLISTNPFSISSIEVVLTSTEGF
jgi:hypothetical protein